MSFQQIFEGFPEARKKHPKTVKEVKKAVLFDLMPQRVSFNPTYYTIYNDTSVLRSRGRISGQTVKRDFNPGTLSREAASRMKRAMEYLLLISLEKEFTVPAGFVKGKHHDTYKATCMQTFITLTLSQAQKHTDLWIKSNMLANFLDTLMKQLPGMSYVWRAETQKNGNIHFHIVTDHFVPKVQVNTIWNRIQYQCGYLDNWIKPRFDSNGDVYIRNVFDAPSCQIQGIRDKKGIKAYMTKYMVKGVAPREKNIVLGEIDSKKNQIAFEMNFHKKMRLNRELNKLELELGFINQRKIKGKLWGCSTNLLVKPISFETKEIGMDLRMELQYRKLLNPDNCVYFSVFSAEQNFFDYIDEMPGFVRDQFVKHYSALFKVKIPPLHGLNSMESYRYN